MSRLTKFQYAVGVSYGGRTSKHIEIAEKALGKRLPAGAIVHHWDENGLNNTPSNLAIFPNEAYHNLIHRRMRAEAACGNPNYQKCQYCQTWDDPTNMKVVQKSDRPSLTYWHYLCRPSRARKASK